jgi:hypothetical protein
MQLSRKQLREAIKTVPMDSVLGVSNELTHKQKEFARLVASGETGAESYRKAYKSKGKPKTVGNEAIKLRKNPTISREIEVMKAANEAVTYQTPQQLRALVIHSLVKVLANDDAKESTKVAAAKVLGTVAGVDAFVTRSEHRVIKSSEDAKGALLAKLREVMNAGATDAVLVDADSLMRELGNDANAAPEAEPPVVDSAGDAAETPTTPNAVRSPTISIHTNEHNRTDSELKDTPPPSNSVTSLEDELSGNTPVSKTE